VDWCSRTLSTLNVHGEGVEGSHSEDSQLTPQETIQKDTNPIVPEKTPGYVSENARARRAEPLTNIVSSHQAQILYLPLMHRITPLRKHTAYVCQSLGSTCFDSSELQLAKPKPPVSGYNLPSSIPSLVVDSTRTESVVQTIHSEKMVLYEPLAHDIAMARRRAILIAIDTPRRIPAAVSRCFKILALDRLQIASTLLQRISAFVSVRIAKEVLALPQAS